MLVAAVAMAFISCQKQEMAGPDLIQVSSLTFSSEKPSFNDEAKTEWTGETIQWSKGDKIRVAYTAGGVWQNAEGNATDDEENGSKTAKIYASEGAEAGEIATFKVPTSFEAIPTGVELEFYGVYPSTVSDASMPYAPSVTVTIPAQQKPLANSFDSKADLMAAKSVSTYILSEENPLPEAIPLVWTRLVAHGYFTLKNLAVVGEENIKSIVLTANAEADMVGQHYLYLDTYNVVKPNGNSAPNKLTIDASNLAIADGSVSFWACFLPCTWTSIAVQVETDKATYTREIDLSTNQKTFAKNARNTLGINMDTATRVEKEVSVGTLPFVRDFSEMTGTAALTELDGFTLGGYVYQASGAIRLAKSEESGTVTTQALDLSKPFHVIVSACGWDSDELALTVSAGEQTHNVVLQSYGFGTNGPDEFRDYALNFSAVGNSETVSFEAAKKVRCYIQKIQVLDGHVELPSTLSATAPDQISADGGEGSFTYTLTNPKDGIQLTVSEDADWITDVVAAEGTVTYTVAPNDTEDPREADITLAYGELTEGVKVSQAGAVPEGTIYYEKVTSAPADWSGTYLIVYENGNEAYVFNGEDAVNGYVSATINSNKILSSNAIDAVAVTIQSMTGGYSLKTANGYIYGLAGSNALKFDASPKANTIEYSNNSVAITSGRVLRFNSATNQMRFRYYEAEKQKPIQLYRLVGEDEGEGNGDGNGSGNGNESAQSKTVSETIENIASNNNWEDATKYSTIALDDVIKVQVNGGGNTGKYYTSGNDWRIYQTESPSLTISSVDGYTINTVKITYSVDKGGTLIYNDSAISSNTIVNVNASSITFGVGNTGSATNGQVRVTAIEVVYQAN